MTRDPMPLYYALRSAADAVDEAAAGRHETARQHLDDARGYAAAQAPALAPEAAHALGLLLDASSPARYRTEGQSVTLHSALSAHALAVLTAADGDRDVTVQANADAAGAAQPLPRLHAAFGVIRNLICGLARDTEAIA